MTQSEENTFAQHINQPGNAWAKSKYLRRGEVPLALALEDARTKGVSLEIIARAEEQGMIDGSFNMTYEGATRIYDRIKGFAEANTVNGTEHLGVLESLDPIADHDLIATTYFCLDPKIRELVQGKLDTLYRIVLNSGRGKRIGYALQVPQRKTQTVTDHTLTSELEAIIKSIPRKEFTGEEEYQRKLRVILKEKAERDIFRMFKKDQASAFEKLEDLIKTERNNNLCDMYREMRDLYREYVNTPTPGVNPNFKHPKTGEKSVMPSLHQKIALYRILQEQRFGVFDEWGTGKTAIGTLAQPAIAQILESMGDEFRRAVVVCPNAGKKAWKKGLIGNDSERYLAEPQTIEVINRNTKDARFLAGLEDKRWVVLNPEQLITNVDCSEELLVERLVEMGLDYLIIDEAQELKGRKNITASGKPTQSAAIRYLAHHASFVTVLTASPIEDKLVDYAVPCHLLNPELLPDITQFEKLYESNPRILYTIFKEKTIRRSSEEINEDLEWDDTNVPVTLTLEQRQLYNHIVEFRPKSWLIQARKALLDPRLVDPEVLERAGLLGTITPAHSAKYKKLEELLTSDDGPVAQGEKFLIFSSMFRDGVTQKGHEKLRAKYKKMDRLDAYEKLRFEESLEDRLQKALQDKFGEGRKIAVIDGTVTDVEERERRINELKKDKVGVLCTTDTGGISLDIVETNHGYFLDLDYVPDTTTQAIGRMLRPGQTKKVHISYLVGENTLDEELGNYLGRKTIVNKIATDGHPLTQEERELLDDTEGIQFGELIKRGLGGISIDVHQAPISSVEDFTVKGRARRISTKAHRDQEYGVTTDAQRVMQLIGQDPQGCWHDPAFVELYMQTLNNLAVPVVHRAKICDLARRAHEGELEFPRRVLSDGSGPSLLYTAYQSLAPTILAPVGLTMPEIVDRDTSQLMLDRGNNPHQVLACMTGKDSPFNSGEFDMVDNESISLLRNREEVEATLRETNRVLKDGGLAEIIVKNRRFDEGFYTSMEQLGFTLLTGKNQGFTASRPFLARIRETLGDHYAQSYANKLAQTYVILAQKTGKPEKNVNTDGLWFARLELPKEALTTRVRPRQTKDEQEPLGPAEEWEAIKKARQEMLGRLGENARKEK